MTSKGQNGAGRAWYRLARRLPIVATATSRPSAWTLATNPDGHVRNGTMALLLALEACEATDFQQPVYLESLAAAYAETGRYADAVATAKQALAAAEKGRSERVAALKSQLACYERRQPFHEALERPAGSGASP
jgi:hypothetical protein